MRRGYFLQPKSGQTIADRLAELGNPVKSFAEECCTFGARSGSETVDALYHAYRSWCRDNGHFPASKGNFSQDLESAFPGLKRWQPRVGEDKRQVKSFREINLRSEWSDDADDGYI
jgi:phage/plasmid-associated DNA primase